MSYLWSFINSLQIQTILLYLNINLPENVVDFINYLNCVNNGIPEITNYIPDASSYLLKQNTIELALLLYLITS